MGELSEVVVHDRYQSYDTAVFAGLIHHLCTAHILRDLADAAECYPHTQWPAQIAGLTSSGSAKMRSLSVTPLMSTAKSVGWLRVKLIVAPEIVGVIPSAAGRMLALVTPPETVITMGCDPWGWVLLRAAGVQQSAVDALSLAPADGVDVSTGCGLRDAETVDDLAY